MKKKFIFISFAILSALLGAYTLLTRYFFSKKPVSIFVEMKVINDKGHPVAGAEIFKYKKQIGTTDSFGEWSLLMDANRASKIPLFIRKQVGNKVLGARKTINVPGVLIDKDTRIKTNVHLSKKWEGEKTSESDL